MEDGHRFAELLSAIAREITLRQSSQVCCGDLTLEQFQTLRAVRASGPLSMGALSGRLRVDLSTTSRNVALLERGGYLLRSRSDEDGRVVHVDITAKGKRALETLRCEERDVLGQVLDRLPSGERPRVIKALEAVHACLDRASEVGRDAVCCAPVPIRKAAR